MPWRGKAGSASHLYLRVGGEHEYEVTHTAFYVQHEPGEQIVNEFAGGGGWGDPLERDPELVLEDVLDEYVSVDGARRDYGVVVEGDLEALDMRVDVNATDALRAEMRAAASSAV